MRGDSCLVGGMGLPLSWVDMVCCGMWLRVEVG
jgi:hypothetical protein